jgi:thiamine-phosphate pyrophosphorylase
VRLILVADAATVGARVLPVVAEVLAALPAGTTMVLDRDPGCRDDRRRLARLAALRDVTARAGAPLVVSQRADLAALCGADGVQLPERALPAAAVRRAFPGLWLGRSCHDGAGLAAAAEGGADWALLSPIAAPLSGKAASGPPLGVEGFAALSATVALPVFALGGVDSELAAALRSRGAQGVACVGFVFGAADPVKNARSLL